jgi:hypothetical protein
MELKYNAWLELLSGLEIQTFNLLQECKIMPNPTQQPTHFQEQDVFL